MTKQHKTVILNVKPEVVYSITMQKRVIAISVQIIKVVGKNRFSLSIITND